MKKTSLLAAGALAASSIVAFGGPANAESGPLDYDCTITHMSVVNDTDAPPEMLVGSTPVPVHLTSTATVPSTVMSLIALLYPGATSVVGTGSAVGVLEGPAPFPTQTLTTPLDIPSTALTDTGDLVLKTVGTSGDFAPPLPGLYAIKAGNFSANLVFGALSGVIGSPLPVSCTPPTGADTTIDTIKGVVPTTTALSALPTSEDYGQKTTATATVTSSNPLPVGGPAGNVVFKVGSRSVTVPLQADGTATAILPKVAAGKTYDVKASYQSAADSFYQSTSSDAQDLKVVQDGTRTSVAAPTIKRRHAEVATIKVRSTHGATVVGKVRATLKKGTRTLKARTVSLRSGAVKVNFGKLRKKGNYTVVAKYLGNQNFKAATGKDAFKVR